MRSRLLQPAVWDRTWILAAGAFLAWAIILGPTDAALAQEITPEMLRRASQQTGLSQQELIRRYEQGQKSAAVDSTQSPGLTQLPSAPRVILPLSEPLSAHAEAAAAAEGTVPSGATIFGAEFFRGDPALFGSENFGPVPGDYLLGPGDQVTVDVWGEVEFRHERLVDRSGAIILPKAGRIPSADRTLDQVSQSILEALSRSYSGIDPTGQGGNTFVEISLGRLRAIRVFVVGEAAHPGGYELSSVATVFTALFAAGGPSAAGSMRKVRLMRGGEEVGQLDLYDYLLSGDRSGDKILRAGDTVFVPTRTTTVEVRGAVRRSMAFELREGEGLAELLGFAGGFETEANTAIVHVNRILPPEEREPDLPDRVQRDLDLTQGQDIALFDGDILSVDRIPSRLLNWVEVRGNVKQPTRYEFRDGLTVADLVRVAGGLWQDTLLEQAVLDRVDARGNYHSIEVALTAALDSTGAGVPLQNRDILHVFSIWDIQDRYRVEIGGEVRKPGTFDWRQGMTLRDLVLKAGGFAEGADLLHAEVARLKVDAVQQRDPSAPPGQIVDLIKVELGEDWLDSGPSFELQAQDRVSIRRLPWWQVQRAVSIRGEVIYPGRYVLDRPDERLSSVLERAGGLRPTAYADGARILREKDQVGNIALDLQRALEDPNSDHDAILESGDEIIVPPVPYTVRIAGAVGFPTSVIWEKGKGFGDYIGRAGGYAQNADKWKSHVVYANGVSRPIRHRWFDPSVLPGSTVIVPVKPPDSGDSKLATLKEISGIIASVATVWLVIDRTN